jgi:hypothetical protein
MFKQTNKTNPTYEITVKSKACLESIQHILGCQSFINSSYTKIVFPAESVEPLSQLSYDDATLLVGYLSEQIMFLQTHHHMTCIGLNVSDILVINKNIFVIAIDANILAFDPNTKRIDFELPFIKPQFTSKTIQEVTMIPASVEIDTNNTSQYCVAALVATLIDMETIKYTKLYWCLARTLNSQIMIYL